MLIRRATTAALAALALAAAGCGGDDDTRTDTNPSAGAEPGITDRETGRSYESGGADGSGADGLESPEDRGGIAAGPDSPDPGESEGADEQFSPPRGGRLEEE
jgi:hypothetical protein